MSKSEVDMRRVGLVTFPGIAHFIVVLIVATVETVGLIIWLGLQTGAAVISVLGPLFAFFQQIHATFQVGKTTFAGIVLGIFLLVEHIITQIDQTGRLSGRALGQIFVFSAIEVVIWIVWLLLIPVNGIGAFLFFFGSLTVEHQIADNVKKGLPFFHSSPVRSRVFQGLLIVTIAEVVGAVVWVSAIPNVSVTVLAVASVIEHYIARNVGEIRE